MTGTGQRQSKVWMWTGLGLCVAGAVGLVVGGMMDVDAAGSWAGVAGGVTALVGLAFTVYSLFKQPTAPVSAVSASGERSVAAGGNIGSVATGDGASATPPPATPGSTSPPPSGTVTASGDRSVAAGGGIDSVSTGDA